MWDQESCAVSVAQGGTSGGWYWYRVMNPDARFLPTDPSSARALIAAGKPAVGRRQRVASASYESRREGKVGGVQAFLKAGFSGAFS